MLKFHLDESVEFTSLSLLLRSHAVSVTIPTEIGFRGVSDTRHLQFAKEQERVIFTHDEDFLEMNSKNTDHFGILFCKNNSRTIREIFDFMLLMNECYETNDMQGRVEYIPPSSDFV